MSAVRFAWLVVKVALASFIGVWVGAAATWEIATRWL